MGGGRGGEGRCRAVIRMYVLCFFRSVESLRSEMKRFFSFLFCEQRTSLLVVEFGRRTTGERKGSTRTGLLLALVV